jgi:Biopolymer transport proteins
MSKHIHAMLAAAAILFAANSFAQNTSDPASEPDALAAAAVSNDVASAAADAGADAAADEGGKNVAKSVTALEAWAEYWRQGGRTMWFLALLSILGLGCALERFFTLRIRHVVPEGFSAQIVAFWKSDKLEDVKRLCSKDSSMLARVVETMLEHSASKDFQEVKMFAEDKAGRELRLENRKASMLATVATLSPLLGLFGTVVGLLDAFTTVAAVGEMGDPSILADSISKALVTTVAGLAIAMPALFCHNIIKNRLNLYAVILEEEVSDLVNNLFVKIPR